MKLKPFADLNRWYVRKMGFFKLLGFQKLEYQNHVWYGLELWFFRIGIEVIHDENTN